MYKLFVILCLLGTDCKDIDQRDYIQSEKLFENINDSQSTEHLDQSFPTNIKVTS